MEKLMNYLLDGKDLYGRILLDLKEYLVTHSKTFDETKTVITTRDHKKYPNGTVEGLVKLINESKIDIEVQPFIMHESNMEMGDFAYPYQLFSASFVIPKPEYKPHIFGILQTFSW